MRLTGRPVVPAATAPARRRLGLTCWSDVRSYRGDQVEFMRAVDDWKRRTGRVRPTDAEVLAIARALGYRRVGEPPAGGSTGERGA